MADQLSPALVAEMKALLDERDTIITDLRSKHSDLMAEVKGMQATMAALQATKKPTAARLADMGRYTGGMGAPKYRFAPGDDEKRELMLEFLVHVAKRDNEGIKEFYDRNNLKTALNENTTTQGAYLVPDILYPEIWRLQAQASPYVRLARRFPVKSDKTLVPARTSSWTTYWIAEGASITQGEPVFGQIDLTAVKLGGFGKASYEVLEDSAPDLLDFLVSDAIEASAVAIDTAGFDDPGDSTGIGDATHTGILRLASNVQTIAATTFEPTYAELVTGIAKLNEAKARGAMLFMSRTVYGNLIKLTDTDGMPIWGGAFGSAMPTLLAGQPFQIVDTFPTSNAVTTPRNFMLYGNLGNLIYGDRREFRFARSDDFLFQNDQVAFRFIQRLAFPNLANAAAVKACFVRFTTTAV